MIYVSVLCIQPDDVILREPHDVHQCAVERCEHLWTFRYAYAYNFLFHPIVLFSTPTMTPASLPFYTTISPMLCT